MKTILVLTDFSRKASCAAGYAMHMAIKSRANILLCHAIESTVPLPDSVEFNWLPNRKKIQEKCMRDLLATAKDLENSIPADSFRPSLECITIEGSLADVISKLLEDRDIDLIICGAQKTGGLLQFFSKSHSHSIMDRIDCPALFIPEGLQFKEIKTIAYATDFSFNNAKVLPFLAELAIHFDASVAVNHISAGDFASVLPKHSIEYSLRKLLKDRQIPVAYHCIKNASVKDALLEITLSGNTDILALVHKKYDFIDGLLHQSISKQLAGSTGVPLLVLPFSFGLNTADISNEELDHFCYESGDLR